jgi:hypothetical protein
MTTFDVMIGDFGDSETAIARGTPAALQMASHRLANDVFVVAYGKTTNPMTRESVTIAMAIPTPAANHGFLKLKRRSSLIGLLLHK